MSLVRRISNVLGFVGGLTQVAVICALTASAGIFAVPAVAQEGVTCGMVETANGPQFWGPCPNKTNRPQAQAQPDVWGAIALSPGTLLYGTAEKFSSEQAAKNFALKDCAGKGAHDCKLAVTVADICVAIAISRPEKVAVVSSPTGATNFASGNATLQCQRAGGHSCKIAVSFCADGINHVVNDPATSAPFGRKR
jgi:hypothetical protein